MAETSVAITPGVGKSIDGFDAGGGMRQAIVVADAVTIGNTQSVSAAGAAKVDGSAVTQPVSMATAPTTPITAAALPLPTNAATSVKQPALGTAGTASTDVLTVQGIASGTPQPVAVGASIPLNVTLQAAAVAIGNGTAQTVAGYVQTVISITGTFVGTIVFEGSMDNGTTYNIPLLGQQLGVSTTPVTSTSNAGAFRVSIDGLTNFRARISAWTSGTITIISNATPLATTNQIAAVNNATKLAGEDLTNDILKTNTVFSYNNIVTNTTTTLKTGSGLAHSISFNNPSAITVASLTLTAYDNTAASGTKIGTWVIPVDTTAKPFVIFLNAAFSTGYTIVTAGPTVAADITIMWR